MSDQFSYPILLKTYSAGDRFKVRAKYLWFDSPAKDYTVGIYSKQNLEVLDSTGSSNILHMDGKTPSGFTKSTYRGMNPSSSPTDGTEEEEEEITEPTGLSDLFAMATVDGVFDFFAFIGICFANFMVCFNPIAWFS